MAEYKVGDQVRVTVEGEITRVLPADGGATEYRVHSGGVAHYIYDDSAQIENSA